MIPICMKQSNELFVLMMDEYGQYLLSFEKNDGREGIYSDKYIEAFKKYAKEITRIKKARQTV